MFVVDASTTIDWLLGTADAAALRAQRQVGRRLLVVPAIWGLETHNVLIKLYRQRKLDADEVADMRLHLSMLRKRIDPSSDQATLDRTWGIAFGNMMTLYDASYVELASRLGLPLATSDGAMRAAASALGVSLI